MTDIAGTADAWGDMDFKVAGTQRGSTALQMDIKIDGVSSELLQRAPVCHPAGRRGLLRLPWPAPATGCRVGIRRPGHRPAALSLGRRSAGGSRPAPGQLRQRRLLRGGRQRRSCPHRAGRPLSPGRQSLRRPGPGRQRLGMGRRSLCAGARPSGAARRRLGQQSLLPPGFLSPRQPARHRPGHGRLPLRRRCRTLSGSPHRFTPVREWASCLVPKGARP